MQCPKKRLEYSLSDYYNWLIAKRESWVEIVRDFRVFFSISAYEVGQTVSYAEGMILLTSLLKETGSHFTTKKMKFTRSFSLEELAILNLTDTTLMINSKKGRKPKLTQKPYEKLPEKMGKAIEKTKFISLLESVASGKIKTKPINKL